MRLNLTITLHRNAVFLFIVFSVMAGIAFWPNYFGRLSAIFPEQIHFHAIAMSLWCIMLVSQGLLIRTGMNRLHRWIGLSSYVMVPFILWSGLRITQFTLQGSNAPSEIFYTSAALMINSLIVFGALFSLAIIFRKDPGRHARYMVSTIFPILTPITDRLIYFHFPSLVQYAPKLLGMPLVPSFGFALADVLVLLLMIIDLITRKNRDVFPTVLGLLLLYHFSYFFFYPMAWWQRFADWVLALPL